MEGRHNLVFLVCAFGMVNLCLCRNMKITYQCEADQSNIGNILLTLRILLNGDDFHSIYAFKATTIDFTTATNRLSTCMADDTGITDPFKQVVTLVSTDDPATPSDTCGAVSTTDTTGGSPVYTLTYVFYIYTMKDDMRYGNDFPLRISCSSDDLNPDFTEYALQQNGDQTVVESQPYQFGAAIVIRDSETRVPLTEALLGTPVCMAVEYLPFVDAGPDTWGRLFYVGFTGNDNRTMPSAAALSIIVYPKYITRTDVMVTAGDSEPVTKYSKNREPMEFDIDVSFMGCADADSIELALKGVEIRSFDKDVCVHVINQEVDTGDQYTAVPADILGTSYQIISPGEATFGEATFHEVMIISTEDDTDVEVTLPDSVQPATYGDQTINPGIPATWKLNKQEALVVSMSDSLTGGKISSSNPVAVIIGDQDVKGNLVTDQLQSTERVGKRFVLFGLKIQLIDGMLTQTTQYHIQRVGTGVTTLTQYDAESGTTTYILDDNNPVQKIDLTQDAVPFELEADKTVQVSMLYIPPEGTDYTTTFMMLPHTVRWNSQYWSNVNQQLTQLVVVHKSTSPLSYRKTLPTAGGDVQVPNGISVNGPSGFVYNYGDPLPSGEWNIWSDNRSPFMCVAMSYDITSPDVTSFTTLTSPFGTRAPPANCKPNVGRAGDGNDNDCDGRVDEESPNLIDDDGDGVADEDLHTLEGDFSEYVGIVAVRPTECEVSGKPDFSDPAYPITGPDGCFIAGQGAFAASQDFQVGTDDNTGGAAELKVLELGCDIELAQFLDHDYLYFRCRIADLCYSVDDTKCTTDICEPSTRKKRQSNSNGTEYVTTKVKVRAVSNTETQPTHIQPTPDLLDQCLQNTSIQLAGGMMLGLCLISMLASCCFCCLLRRKWRSKKHKKQDAPHSRYTPSRASHSRRY